MQNKRWMWGREQTRTFFLWKVDVCELNNFGSFVEEGNTHQANQISLAVRGVTAVPALSLTNPVVQEPLGWEAASACLSANGYLSNHTKLLIAHGPTRSGRIQEFPTLLSSSGA